MDFILKNKKNRLFGLVKPAFDLLADRTWTKNDDLIFDLPLNDKANERLKHIVSAAGIDGKKLRFHTAMHTATMLLSLGMAIGAVSSNPPQRWFFC
jgi:hypothetical protein